MLGDYERIYIKYSRVFLEYELIPRRANCRREQMMAQVSLK